MIGIPEDWGRPEDTAVFTIFDEAVIEFFADLSGKVLGDPMAHAFPDVVAFALWCRKSALTSCKAQDADGSSSLGRGLVFHISPANVPIMFAYSLAMVLLSGKANLVRLPSRQFPQVEYCCRQDRAVLHVHHGLRDQ